METIALLAFGLPGNAGGAGNVVIEGTVVNCVPTAIVVLPNIHSLTAVVPEGADAVIHLHHSTWRRGAKP